MSNTIRIQLTGESLTAPASGGVRAREPRRMPTTEAQNPSQSGGQPELEIREVTQPADADLLRARVSWRGWDTAGCVEVCFAPPVSRAEYALLTWYATDFRSWLGDGPEREKALSAERTTLTIGRKLGNLLVDPQYRFLAFCEQVEAHAARDLQVRIVAEQGRFDALPWELLILPDSKYVLSATCAGFVRAADAAHATRSLQLGTQRPLGYLRALSRPTDCTFKARPQCVSLAWRQLDWQGALNYQLLTPATPETWRAQLQRDQPMHVLHWDGPLTERGGVPCFVMEGPTGDPEAVAAAQLASDARRLGVELLIIEASPAQQGLAARTARAARSAGIANLLVVAEPSDGVWPSSWLAQFLAGLRSGLSVQQAVVETRKALQRALVELRSADGSAPYAAHSCSGLQLYADHELVCFERALDAAEYEALEAQRTLRADLLGFGAAPSADVELADDAALAIDRALRSEEPIFVQGARGAGKTHTLQQVALFERGRGEIRRAYRWDFRAEAYSLRDVLQMVAVARGLPEPEHADEERLLQTCKPGRERELFVFDDIDLLLQNPDGRAAAAALIRLAGKLCRAGMWCAFSATDRRAVGELFAACGVAQRSVPLSAAAQAAQVAFVRALAPKALTLGAAFRQLLDQLDGNPFLLQKVAARCQQDNVDALLSEARVCYGKEHAAQADAPLGPFLLRRWQGLAPHLQQFLTLCAELSGLYLEVAMIGLDARQTRVRASRELARSLGASDAISGADMLAALNEAGFLSNAAGGRCLEPVAAQFLQAHRLAPAEVSAEARALFACVVCQGLTLVIEGSQRQPETFITHNLVANRHALSVQIERALRCGEYALGTLALIALHGLLQQTSPQLSEELAPWALGVLEVDDARLAERSDAAAATAWLNLALRALSHEAAARSPALRAGRQAWSEIVASQSASLPLPLLGLAVRFLQQTYDRAGEYAEYRSVTLAACERLQAEANYPALIVQLQCLAAAEHALEHASECLRIEARLLDEIPYAQLQDGAQLRQRSFAQLAATRLRRRDESACRELLARIEREPASPDGAALATLLRAELALLGEQASDACLAFCQLWKAGMGGVRSVDVAHVGGRLRRLREELGASAFDELYAEHAGSTPTPEAMGISAR
jgi:hypothetical protein